MLRRTITITAAVLLGMSAAAFAGAAPPHASDRDPQESPHLDLRALRELQGDPIPASARRQPSVVDDRPSPASLLATLDADTLPWAGVAIGITSYDIQHNYSQGHQVATNPGSETVHFSWTMWDVIPVSVDENNRFVEYNSWDKPSGTTNQGFNGTAVSLGEFARGGYVRIDVDGANKCNATFHQRIESVFPNSAWYLYYPIEGSSLHLDQELPKSGLFPDEVEHLWADIAVAQNQGLKDNSTDIVHIISEGAVDAGGGLAQPSDRIWYWRYDRGVPTPIWEGPVLLDSSRDLSYVIDAADDSGKVAVALTSDYWTDGFGEVNNVAYHESHNAGGAWLDGSELGPAYRYLITSYNDEYGPQAWPEISVSYDHDGVLHIVFLEQLVANQSEEMALRHWSNARGTVKRVTEAYYENLYTWRRAGNLAHISLGIGDGSTLCGGEANTDYLYVLYMKLGGTLPEEMADHSELGFANGELYLTTSRDAGLSWSRPANLTQTKTPACTSSDPDSVCASECWATIARDVADIEIFYVGDYEPGDFNESGWTINRVVYLNYPGGTADAEHLCPVLEPVIEVTITSVPTCEYHAPPGGLNPELLTIRNLGNALLTGNVSVAPEDAWLSISGGGAFTIPEGSADLEVPVFMDATGLAEGLYSGSIAVTHDDTSKPSPLTIPIDFYVTEEFFCPEDLILRTAVASPGVLSLQVGSDGRFGAPHDEGGLWRYLDSSKSIADATLLITHSPPDGDTVVYHRFGKRDVPGQYGFRSLAELTVDTTDYGWGDGYAWARAEMSTADSLLGVTVQWFFPQHPDSADFVIAKYTLANRTDAPLTDIAIGLYADLNVSVPPVSTRYNIQERESDNHGWYHAPLNLIYQYGYDSIGHIPYYPLNTCERYSGGFTYIAGRDYAGGGTEFENQEIALRGRIDDNDINIVDGGPPTGHLYNVLVGPNGVTVREPPAHSDSAKDLYTALTLDQGLTLAPGETSVYVVGLVSDTLSHYGYNPAALSTFAANSLEEVVLKAWAWAADNAICQCPCHGDAQCDGIDNVLDVVIAINVAFRGGEEVYDYDCPFARTDVTCDGVTDITDVVRYVDVVFRDADPGVMYCDPCL
ncbi:MAG TPA: hypothetical protein VM118_04645 [Acidobacteriota bacterium]|nr:hypothetical protein [Acidobacteriota bacterium]